MPQPAHHHPAHHAAHHTAAPRPLWEVVRQELDTRYIPGLDPQEEWLVYFVTRSGSSAYVRIPIAEYTAEAVAGAITPVADEMEKVAALKQHA